MKKLSVLSLFNGMGCVWLALDGAGLQVGKRYSSEIDKYAIKLNDALYPDTVQLGDVRNVDVSKLGHIDLVTSGSPCQSFSFAGKRKGMSTTCEIEIVTLDQYLKLKSEGFEFEGQSYLFWEFVRILEELKVINPDIKFLFENVEMGKEWETVLCKALGYNAIHINSALVSAQNRKRIYIVNFGLAPGGLFGDLESVIKQPKDRGILLRDVLENDVADKYYLSDKMMSYFKTRAKNFNNGKVNIRDEEGKSSCLTASMAACDISDNFIAVDCNGKEYNDKSGAVLARYANVPTNFGSDTFIKIDKQGNVKSNQNKASCFTAGGHSGGNHSDMDLLIVASRGMENSGKWEQELEPRNDGKTNTITSVQKDNLVLQLNGSKESGGQQPYQQNRVYDTNGISTALMAQMSCGSHAILVPEATNKGFIEVKPGDCFDFENPKSETRRGRKMDDKSNCLMAKETDFMQYTKDFRIRRLTERECCRLQTIPEPAIDKMLSCGVSGTQVYRAVGNGWTIDVISYLFSYLGVPEIEI